MQLLGKKARPPSVSLRGGERTPGGQAASTPGAVPAGFPTSPFQSVIPPLSINLLILHPVRTGVLSRRTASPHPWERASRGPIRHSLTDLNRTSARPDASPLARTNIKKPIWRPRYARESFVQFQIAQTTTQQHTVECRTCCEKQPAAFPHPRLGTFSWRSCRWAVWIAPGLERKEWLFP